MSAPHSRCRSVAAAIREAREVCVLTGAGVSVPSGIPDFRSPGGIWLRYPPMEYATIDVFRSHPERFWELNHILIAELGDAAPNPAHFALAELEALGFGVSIVTQNIDGLHQAAGSTRVFEVHGGKDALVCLSCGARRPLAGYPFNPPEVPRCEVGDPPCGQPLKPDVVYFGEMLPEGVFQDALAAVARSEVLLVVGTSAQVFPAAALPQLAHQAGATVCEFNLEATDLTRSGIVSHFVEGSCDETLPALLTFMKEASHE